VGVQLHRDRDDLCGADVTQRWTFLDPDNGVVEYVFERNPKQVGSPYPNKKLDTLSTGATATPNIRGLKQPDTPVEWSFTGTLASQAMYDQLLSWSAVRKLVQVIDDLGRTYNILPTGVEFSDRAPTPRHPVRYEYTFKALLFPTLVTPNPVAIDQPVFVGRPILDPPSYVPSDPSLPTPPETTPGTPVPPVTPPTPPGADATIKWGSAFGSNLSWQLTNFPAAKSARHFTTPITLYSSSSASHRMPTPAEIWESAKPDPASVINGSMNSLIDAWIASWTRDVVLTFWHEPEQGQPNYRVPPATWVPMQRVLLARVAAVGNSHVKTAGILMSYTLSFGNSRVDSYFKPSGTLIGFDYYAFDCYKPAHTILAMNWAQSNGVAWAIPEWGTSTGPGGDADTKAQLIQMVSDVSGYKPHAVMYFDAPVGPHLSPLLINAPLTDSYLKGLAGP
jgi:hypothetical protein